MVNWLSVRFLLTMSIALKMDTKAIDFTMPCTRAELKTKVFMEIPYGCNLATNESQSMFCLKLFRNLYGMKDGGYKRFECLESGLIANGFR